MTRRTALAAVPADPPKRRTSPRSRAKSVTQAAADGDSLALLVAMRTRVAEAIEDLTTPARDLAALTRRLIEINKEIEAVGAREERPRAGTPDESFDASAI